MGEEVNKQYNLQGRWASEGEEKEDKQKYS